MKNFNLTVLLILAACGASYGVFYMAARPSPDVRVALEEKNAMAWLRADFNLDGAQFAAIQRLHVAYGKVCSLHCAAIREARASGGSAAEVARLEGACEEAMVLNFHKVAALMDPEEGRRYLDIVLPRVARYDHHGAPSVQVNP